MSKTPSQRRKFLGKAAAVGAGTMAFPMISKAQTVSLRFQSTWPSKDIFHEYAQDFAHKVNEMAGGRLKIEVLPAGAVVPAFQLLEAVAKGTLDGGHGVVAETLKTLQCFSAFLCVRRRLPSFVRSLLILKDALFP